MAKLFVFTCLMFGIPIFFRQLGGHAEKNLFSRSGMTKIAAIFLFWLAFWSALPKISSTTYIILTLLPHILLLVAPHVLRAYRRKKFADELPSVLSNLVLKLHLGRAFLAALEEARRLASPVAQIKLKQIIEQLALKEQVRVEGDKAVLELLEFFKACEREPHLALTRLKSYRSKLEAERRFARRAQTALRPVRAQIVLLAVMYTILAGVVIQRYGFTNVFKLVLATVCMLVLGAYISLRQGRKTTWTV